MGSGRLFAREDDGDEPGNSVPPCVFPPLRRGGDNEHQGQGSAQNDGPRGGGGGWPGNNGGEELADRQMEKVKREGGAGEPADRPREGSKQWTEPIGGGMEPDQVDGEEKGHEEILWQFLPPEDGEKWRHPAPIILRPEFIADP